MTYNFPDAFHVMTYECEGCKRREAIWNSRDGVTPFLVTCTYCGGQMQHINWHHDRVDPDYIPPRGSRVFISFPDSLKRTFAVRALHEYEDRNKGRIGDPEREQFIKSYLDSIQDNSPFLVKV